MLTKAILLLTLTLSSVASAQAPPEPLDDSTLQLLRDREQDILARVQQAYPDRYEDLMALQDTNPRAYVRTLWRLSRLIDHGPPPPHGERVSPEVHEQRMKLEAIRRQHFQGDTPPSGAELASIREEVAQIAEQIFVLKQAERRRRIEKLRAAIAELEQDVAKRDEEREQRIRNFVDDFLRPEPRDL